MKIEVQRYAVVVHASFAPHADYVLRSIQTGAFVVSVNGSVRNMPGVMYTRWHIIVRTGYTLLLLADCRLLHWSIINHVTAIIYLLGILPGWWCQAASLCLRSFFFFRHTQVVWTARPVRYVFVALMPCPAHRDRGGSDRSRYWKSPHTQADANRNSLLDFLRFYFNLYF